MNCDACGSASPDQARFCLHCGAPLAAGAVVPQADAQRSALEAALGARYEIGRLLGRGGMGAVYVARERALERTVAIKVLAPERRSGSSPRMSARMIFPRSTSVSPGSAIPPTNLRRGVNSATC